MIMIVCGSKYLHKPEASDMRLWPFDTPWIMWECRKRGLTVCNAGSQKPSEIFDATGQKWMHRALRAEAHLRDAEQANSVSIAQVQQAWLLLLVAIYVNDSFSIHA